MDNAHSLPRAAFYTYRSTSSEAYGYVFKGLRTFVKTGLRTFFPQGLSAAPPNILCRARAGIAHICVRQQKFAANGHSMHHICTICESPFLLDSDSATVDTETVVTTCGTQSQAHISVRNSHFKCRTYLPPGLLRGPGRVGSGDVPCMLRPLPGKRQADQAFHIL